MPKRVLFSVLVHFVSLAFLFGFLCVCVCQVRRGAGALETGRRVGQQLSRRIHTLMTSDDPDLVIK